MQEIKGNEHVITVEETHDDDNIKSDANPLDALIELELGRDISNVDLVNAFNFILIIYLKYNCNCNIFLASMYVYFLFL